MINALLERDLIPDALIRRRIRSLLRLRLRQQGQGSVEDRQRALSGMIAEMDRGPIALATDDANRQHYEVPTEFFRRVLGPHLKYSSAFWRPGATLERAEADMLALSCRRAELVNGQDVLELGCGWGAFTLYAAEHFPQSRFTAVTNSRTQREHVEAAAKERGLANVRVLGADMNSFRLSEQFHRMVSIEMFEHMRNVRLLLKELAVMLRPGGKLFVHVFCHREYAYFFEARDETDWMARHFFTGGMMPSQSLLLYFQDALQVVGQWSVDGTHYQATLEAWLQRMDAQRAEILPLLAQAYGPDHALKWWVYWRIFFMSCAELFGWRRGKEWFVGHYLFEKVP